MLLSFVGVGVGVGGVEFRLRVSHSNIPLQHSECFKWVRTATITATMPVERAEIVRTSIYYKGVILFLFFW